MPDKESKVTGTEQVVKNLSTYSKAMFTEIVAGCEAVQQKVMNNAKIRVPKVTHNLEGSILPGGIIVTDTNVTASVAANANYAGFVEGVDENWKPLENWTRRITPYLGPALLENIGTFRKAMAAAVKRAENSI